jgi:hypothetical protein
MLPSHLFDIAPHLLKPLLKSFCVSHSSFNFSTNTVVTFGSINLIIYVSTVKST